MTATGTDFSNPEGMYLDTVVVVDELCGYFLYLFDLELVFLKWERECVGFQFWASFWARAAPNLVSKNSSSSFFFSFFFSHRLLTLLGFVWK